MTSKKNQKLPQDPDSSERAEWKKTVAIWKQLIKEFDMIDLTGQKRPAKVISLTGQQRELLKKKLNKKDKKD